MKLKLEKVDMRGEDKLAESMFQYFKKQNNPIVEGAVNAQAAEAVMKGVPLKIANAEAIVGAKPGNVKQAHKAGRTPKDASKLKLVNTNKTGRTRISAQASGAKEYSQNPKSVAQQKYRMRIKKQLELLKAKNGNK